MKLKSFFLWIISLLLTLGLVLYQRFTGPTYPIKGRLTLAGENISFNLKRSHPGEKDHLVMVTVPSMSVVGKILWKRYPTDDPWEEIEMQREGNILKAALPHQPRGGKIQYRVILIHEGQSFSLSGDHDVIIRFRGDVPWFYLIPHIVLMFVLILFSIRAGLEAIVHTNSDAYLYILAWIITAMLLIGGILLGAITQYYAFGAFWTGFPLGHDLTDTKTLVAMVFWLVALWKTWRVKDTQIRKQERWWILAASLITLAVYFIPHSLMGTELDYTKLPAKK